MPQPAATAAARAAAPPLLPGLQEEGEFVDVDLGGGQQQHQPAAPVRRDAGQQQPPAASACPARSFCVAAADALLGCLLSCCLDPPCDRKGVKNQ